MVKKNKNSKSIKSNTRYERMGQYSYTDEEYIEKVADDYGYFIGLFLIEFSRLEQSLNEAIADQVFDDAHHLGFVIIEKMSFHNKIDMFYKSYIAIEGFKNNPRTKTKLKIIKDRLFAINIFRNSLVHAYWGSLAKGGLVRTKIIVNKEDGQVEFKIMKIQKRTIGGKITEINKLIDQLFSYKEKALSL